MNCAATRKPTYSVNLDSTLRKVYLNDIFATGDCCANGVTLPMFKGNAPAEFGDGATVKGYFTRYGEKESVLLTGELNGHVASVELNKACYTKSGQFALVVKVYEGDVTSTIFYGEGSVLVADAGEYIDPDGIVPSLDDLLARIAEMEAATNAGKAAAADAQAAAQEARQTAADMQGQMDAHKADTAAALSAQKDTKADAIMDTSARAASHSLHAQDGKMHVTLYGKTTETGTGDKSPENPYAIGGVGAADIHVGGKNLIRTYTNTGIADSIAFQPVLRGTFFAKKDMPLVFSAKCDKTVTLRIASEAFAVTAANRTVNATAGVRFTVSLKAAADGWINNVSMVKSGEDGTSEALTFSEVQLEIGEAATPYEPYSANAYALPLLPDGAPLMGSGEIFDTIENDVLVDGESKCRATRRWAKIVLDGSADENWKHVTAGKHVYWYNVTSAMNGAQKPDNGGIVPLLVCAEYTSIPYWTMYEYDKTCVGISSGGYLSICDTRHDTLESFTAALAANPITVWYALATPEIYVTDPIAIRKPSGIMPVTVMGSGETAVEYPHDTKHYTDAQHDSLAEVVESNAEAVNSLSEDKADKEGPYRLISEVTTTEEVAIIDINFDDGYKRIKVEVRTKQTDSNKPGVIVVWGRAFLYAQSMTDTRGDKNCAVDAELRNGYVFVNTYGGGLGSENDLQFEGETRLYPRAVRGYVPESGLVRVAILSGAVFPIGTEVTVEGVR